MVYSLSKLILIVWAAEIQVAALLQTATTVSIGLENSAITLAASSNGSQSTRFSRAFSTRSFSGSRWSNASAPSTTALVTTPSLSANASFRLGNVDGCFSSWESYWSASRAALVAEGNFARTSGILIPTRTVTTTYTLTDSGASGTTITSILSTDKLFFVEDGGFTIATSTESYHWTQVQTLSPRPASTQTYTLTYSIYSSLRSPAPSMPTCLLPSVVEQCQKSWEAWISTQLVPSPTPPPHCELWSGNVDNRTVPACASRYWSSLASYSSFVATSTPGCKAASISGTLCQSVRDGYQRFQADDPTVWLPNFPTVTPLYFDQGTVGARFDFGRQSTSIWPTSSALGSAIGCTLGCGRCAMTGGTVQLVVWAKSTRASGSSTSFTADAITQASAVPSILSTQTVEAFGTTLTSPTLYVVFTSVYAQNACGPVGTGITSTILAIPTASALSSKYGLYLPRTAPIVFPTFVKTYTAPFNVDDLEEPVPYSIYSSQPWCQSWNALHATKCSSERPYQPIIVVPDDLLRGLQPAWSHCWGDIRGHYDPPLTVTPTSRLLPPITTTSDPALERQTAIPVQTEKLKSTTAQTMSNFVTVIPVANEGTLAGGRLATVTRNVAGDIVNGQTTIAPGETGTVNGMPVKNEGTNIVILPDPLLTADSSTNSIGLGEAGSGNGNPSPVATAGTQAIVPIYQDSPVGLGLDRVVIGGATTLRPGQSTIINGTPVVVRTSEVIVGTSTIPLTRTSQQAVVQAPTTTFTAGVSVSTLPNGFVVVSIGTAQLTIASSDLAAATSAGLHTATILQALPRSITAAGLVITADPQGAITIGTQTLRPGGMSVMVSGTTYSLGPSGAYIVANGKTTSIPTPSSRQVTITYSMSDSVGVSTRNTAATSPASATSRPGPTAAASLVSVSSSVVILLFALLATICVR